MSHLLAHARVHEAHDVVQQVDVKLLIKIEKLGSLLNKSHVYADNHSNYCKLTWREKKKILF